MGLQTLERLSFEKFRLSKKLHSSPAAINIVITAGEIRERVVSLSRRNSRSCIFRLSALNETKFIISSVLVLQPCYSPRLIWRATNL